MDAADTTCKKFVLSVIYCANAGFAACVQHMNRDSRELVHNGVPKLDVAKAQTKNGPTPTPPNTLRRLGLNRRINGRMGNPTTPSGSNRQQSVNKDRSNEADRRVTQRRTRSARSGEGSASALATLKNIERERERSKPKDDSGDQT